MDLHVVGPAATPDERAAIDAVLDPHIGPARSGWDGGTRDTALEGHVAYGGHDARANRHLLLPALNATAGRTGWVSRGALNHISKRLSVPPADAYGVASFYALTPTTPRAPIAAHVCDDIACRLAGAERICEELETTVGHAGAPLGDGDTTWLRSPCLGQCERAPAVLVTVAGPEPGGLVVGEIENAEAVVDTLGWVAEVAHEGPGRVHAELRDVPAEPLEWVRGLAPQAGNDGLVLLARVGRVDPTSLDAYRASGGYEALTSAIAMGPTAVIEAVTGARLLGRGGAAFPTGRKWAAVATQPAQPHYLVCNADESEPGTFKDRVLLEGDPFATIEAMTIAAFATGASQGYLYIRGEYPEAEAAIAHAIDTARVAGLL